MHKLILTLSLLAPLPCNAIVSMKDIHLMQPEEGIGGSVGMQISGDRGNTEKDSTGFDTQVYWRHAPATEVLQLHYAYGESGGVRDTDQAFAHLRHMQELDASLGWEAYAQVESNEFARLSLRRVLGAGMRFLSIGDERTVSYVVGLGAFHEDERLTGGVTNEDQRIDTWRGNAYLILQARLNDQARLFSTTYAQPALDDMKDLRLLEQAGILVSITERLDLKLTVNMRYDSRPPLEVEKYDLQYRSGIEFDF